MGEARRRGLVSAARPLPKLAEFLGESRGEAFEAYVAEMLRNQRWADSAGDKEQRLLVRMLRVLGIAAVEALREAAEAGGEEGYVEAVRLLPRVMGHSAVTATAGICRDDTPWRELSTVLIEEFRFGARQAADQLERMNGGGA